MNFKRFSPLILALLTLFHCHKEEESKHLDLLLLLLGMNGSSGDYYNRLYYVHPLFFDTLNEYQYLPEASAALLNPANKKLILMHGWDLADRDNAPKISQNSLKQRAAEFWTEALNSTEIRNLIGLGGYDLLIYDYLTSNAIDANGVRFRAKLDSLFTSGDTVVIFAHSMGGLVTRFAVYENTRPAYLAKVITAGTPYHGSPWASPEFQGDRGSLGTLAAYFTNTDGGRDLAYDNYDGVLTAASNAKLSGINALSDRDDLFTAYYGSCDYPGGTLDCATSLTNSQADGLLTPACPFLYHPTSFSNYPSFSPSDCIVPAASARLDRSGIAFPTSVNVGKFDHFDIKLGIASIRQRLIYTDLP